MADNQNPWLGYPLDNHIIFLISNAAVHYALQKDLKKHPKQLFYPLAKLTPKTCNTGLFRHTEQGSSFLYQISYLKQGLLLFPHLTL